MRLAILAVLAIGCGGVALQGANGGDTPAEGGQEASNMATPDRWSPSATDGHLRATACHFDDDAGPPTFACEQWGRHWPEGDMPTVRCLCVDDADAGPCHVGVACMVAPYSRFGVSQ